MAKITYQQTEFVQKRGGVFGICLFVIICWCMALRQAVQALPWEESLWLVYRDDLLVIGLAVGSFGTLVCFGCLMLRCIGLLVPSQWYSNLAGSMGCLAKAHTFSVLFLVATLCCATPFIIPEVGRYWGVGYESGMRAYGVLIFSDAQWWNPAWLYVRLLFTLIMAWGGGIMLQKNLHIGGVSLMLFLLVLVVGNLGFDLLAAPYELVQSIFPIYMVVSALLAGLAAAMLPKAPAGRSGAMLMALVMIKLWLVYSLVMITWYARLPQELEFLGMVKDVQFGLALIIQLALPCVMLLVRQIRENSRCLQAISACVIIGMMLENYAWFDTLPHLSDGGSSWLLGGIVVLLCVIVLWCSLRKEGNHA